MTILNDYIESKEDVSTMLSIIEHCMVGALTFRKVWQKQYDDLYEYMHADPNDYEVLITPEAMLNRYMLTMQSLGSLGFIKLREE